MADNATPGDFFVDWGDLDNPRIRLKEEAPPGSFDRRYGYTFPWCKAVIKKHAQERIDHWTKVKRATQALRVKDVKGDA
ncbi:hypothetical protein E1264_03455 [Actinomadura sp. KC216]|uniref:hypothetical protein n=1 Tax=Actinomadura sp. KC216 TaxID=2530370 RepID=UPI00104FCF5B|nr:hypothetical protein [Actinomadura sp. KC216]TDB90896.1 hypothetical protein E1264_03455 [Actinomadura sp. KC216]